MNRHPKYKQYLALSIGLIIIGGIILITQTTPPLYRAHLFSLIDLIDHCSLYVRCVTYSVLYVHPIDTDEVIQLDGNMTFKSTFLFTVDNQIRYNFSFKSETPELIKEVDFVLNSKFDDVTNPNPQSIQDTLDNAREHEKLIQLTKSDNKFQKSQFWTHPIKEDVIFDVIVIDRYNNPIFLNKTKSLIELESVSEYFTALEAFNSRINDQVILGLTWAGISAIFILLGGDILFRIKLRETRVDKWFEDKSKYDLDPI